MISLTTKTRRPTGCGKSRAVESEENQKQVFLPSHRPWKSRKTRGIPTFPTAPTAAGISQTRSGILIVVDRKECLTSDTALRTASQTGGAGIRFRMDSLPSETHQIAGSGFRVSKGAPIIRSALECGCAGAVELWPQTQVFCPNLSQKSFPKRRLHGTMVCAKTVSLVPCDCDFSRLPQINRTVGWR